MEHSEVPSKEWSRDIVGAHGNSSFLARMASAVVLVAAASLSLAVPAGAVGESVCKLPLVTAQGSGLADSAATDGPGHLAKAGALALPAKPRRAYRTASTGVGQVDVHHAVRTHSLADETTPKPALRSPDEPCEEVAGVTCVSPGEGGILTESVTAQSADRLAEVVIPQGTMALTAERAPLMWIRVGRLETPPSPPGNHAAVSSIYNFEPGGATFDGPAVVTLRYSDEDVPAGVREESLVIAAWSSFLGVWVELESVVDVTDNALSAETTYLTAVVVLAGTTPASFRLSQLTIVPEEVDIDDAVVVSALIENSGDLTDVLHVEFRVNGELFDSKEVTLDGHNGITVSSDELVMDQPGRYTVSINDLAANFTVKEPVVVPPPPPDRRADIQFTDLTITPARSEVGQAVTVGIVATNHGDMEGNHSVALLVNGRFTDSELIKLAPGERYVVTFVVTERVSGTYSVVVEGWGATLMVGDVVETFGVGSGIIGWVIGGAVAAIAGLVYLMRSRRREPRMTPGDDGVAANQEDMSAKPPAEGRTG